MSEPNAPTSILHRIFRRRERKRTVADYFMLAVFSLMFGGLGIMLIFVGGREFIIQRRIVATAQPVQATILSARVVSTKSSDTDTRTLRDNSTTTHTPEVRFSYTIGDVRYESDMLYPTIIQRGYASVESAEEELVAYQPGAVVQAFADSSLPERGFLRLEKSNNPVWFMVAGGLSFALLGAIYRFA